MTYRRFAVFVTPPPGPLADFTAGWLGWDAAAGEVRPHQEIPGLPRPVAALTEAPRRYGFHGTVKPPFRLAAGTTAEGLAAALRDLCARLAPVRLEGLQPDALGAFLALRPVGRTAALDALAAEVVAELDGFRAPPEPDELARRRAAGLSARQEALLRRWGYPYVMEEFRYHMTLTGSLEAPEHGAVAAALAPHLAPLVPAPCEIADLTLVGEGADGRFRHVARMPLSG